MHGIGNDFVLIDGRGLPSADWGAMARALCDRHRGVGGDGLLLVLDSAVADFRMRMFNPDGSEAEMCGNGIRCTAKYIYDRGLLRRESLAIETKAGVKQLRLRTIADSTRRAGGAVEAVTVDMGKPRLAGRDIPVALDMAAVMDYPLTVADIPLALTCLSMGNPHAVAFLEGDPAAFPLATIGPQVEHHPFFPQRVNFEVCRVLDGGRIAARVWERGAGETLACGTGACAVAVAARLKGLVGDSVRIELPGGALELEWDGVGEVRMTGPAAFVFRGVWMGTLPG